MKACGIYDSFIARVAEGRGMTVEGVNEVAGRVWTGQDALEIGLVDGMGNLQDAVAIAADLAGLAKPVSWSCRKPWTLRAIRRGFAGVVHTGHGQSRRTRGGPDRPCQSTLIMLRRTHPGADAVSCLY